MKLGIVVVYLLRENGRPLLDLHLERIARHTSVPYTIYGAPLRLPPAMRALLEQRPEVRLVDLPAITGVRVSVEHSSLLDGAVARAMQDNPTHLAAMHVDSFPIRDGWAQDLAQGLDDHRVAAAILRAENGDKMLPFPAGMLWTAAYQARCNPRFLLDPDVLTTPQYQEFAKTADATQESGLGYAFSFWQHGVTWRRLLRSNRRCDHYMIASLYEDMFFHLGAAARTEHRFRGDVKGDGRSLAFRGLAALRGTGRSLLPAFVRTRLEQRHAQYLARTEAKNKRMLEHAFHRLTTEPDRYIDWLAGQD